jgi:hypothetical protein
MREFKKKRIELFLQAMATTKSLFDGNKKYQYSFYSVPCKDNASATMRGLLLMALSTYAKNKSGKLLDELVKVEDKIYNLELEETTDWDTKLQDMLQNWFFIDQEGSEGVQMSSDLDLLIKDFFQDDKEFKYDEVSALMIPRDLEREIHRFWGGSDCDDIIFKVKDKIYILHFQVRA